MFVKDETRVAEHLKQQVKEERVARMRGWATSILQLGQVLLDPATNPTELEHQLGKHLTTEEFEKKLKKLNPNFQFEEIRFLDGALNKSCKRLVWRYQSERQIICVYSIGTIPEFSLHSVREEEIPDVSVESVGAKDLPAYTAGTVEVETDKNSENYGDVRGDGYTFHGVIPGIIKVKVPGQEIVRGWRTVLSRIVLTGAATPTEIEKVFGSCNKLSWAAYMGKTDEHPLM